MKVDATHQGDPKQTPKPIVPSKYSRLDQHYKFGNTHRFGEYGINFVMDTDKNDHIILHQEDETRSYTMKAPLIQNITRHKEYFNVPMQAILPNNFDTWYQQPAHGDDVPDYVNCTDISFISRIRSIWNNFKTNELLPQWDGDNQEWISIDAVMKAAIFIEMFFSHGSLLASLGCHLEQFIEWNAYGEFRTEGKQTIDNWIQRIYNGFKTKYFTVSFKTLDGSSETFVVNPPDGNYVNNVITFHEFLERARQNLNFSFHSDASDTDLYGDWITTSYFDDGDDAFDIMDASNTPIDLSRLHAYQIICAHYFTNDSIDYVYSAELYRNLIGTYYNEAATAGMTGAPEFNWNGINKIYDWCSAYVWKEIVSDYITNYESNISLSPLAKYLTAVFSFRKSLRYVDYFTGAKAQPIATGDYEVSVNSNKVSIIEVTKGIQLQRLGNAVQRIGRKAKEYLEELKPGVRVAYDYHDPEFLGRKSDVIYAAETENTGADQLTEGQTVTTTLHGQSNRYAFEFTVDRPGIIIGITYFDIERLYTQGIERQFFIKNRYDMINPFLQDTGDQYVYLEEIGRKGFGSDKTKLETFAYQMKYQEYRCRVNQAAGGFVNNLPGWAFLDTMEEADNFKKATISPEFIRCHNSELDNFYISLIGDTLEKYFHFICRYTNNITGKRQLTAVPKIM